MNRAYLSLGSNVNPESNLKDAVRLLSRCGTVCAVSSVWESPPFECAHQPFFLNAALLLETALSAAELRERTRAIELQLGRVREEDRNAPRTIDIDIMLFNDDILTLGNRRIPDGEILERPHVAIPLAEIAPDYRHPETGETLARIARRFIPHDMRRRDDVSF